MQSLRRAIKRGNAMLTSNKLTNQVKAVYYKGSNKVQRTTLDGQIIPSEWEVAEQERDILAEEQYFKTVTNPI